MIAMLLLNNILKKCTAGYKVSKSKEKINHIMYMDDIKLLEKIKKKKLDSNKRCKNVLS